MRKLLVVISTLFLSYFLFAQSDYKLIEKETYASCIKYEIINKDGKSINLPEKFNEVLDCPSMIDITGNILTYELNGVRQYNIYTKKDILLFTNYDDIDGCSGPAWSEDKSKLMFVVINQERKHNYKASCRIIVISLNDKGELKSKQKFDRNVNFSCGGICSSEPEADFWFVNENKIGYKVHVLYKSNFETEEIEIE